MSVEHTPEHEELLQLHLLREEGDDAVQLPADCPRCQERLEELRGLVSSLEGAASLERDVLLLSDELDEAPGEGHVYEFVQDLAKQPREPWGGRVWLLVAAGLLLLSVLGWRWIAPSDSDPDRGRVTLGDTEGIVGPVGEVTDYHRFHWEADLPTGGWFEVRVLDAADELLDESEELPVSEWSPPAETRSPWPDRILWQVRTYDGTGTLVSSFEAEAWRSSD